MKYGKRQGMRRIQYFAPSVRHPVPDWIILNLDPSGNRGEKLAIHRIFERLIPDRAVKTYLLVLALIFSAGFLAGVFAPVPIRRELSEAFRALADQYLDQSGGILFLFILLNNVFASLFLLVSGLLLGILPVLSVGFNGFVLGIFYRLSSGVEGYGRAAVGVLPHGIFEIPALLVAAAYGLWLGMAVLRRVRRKEHPPLGAMLNHALERYFVVVFPLLVVAAAVETSVILWAS
jgi:stage II sporulation protein M